MLPDLYLPKYDLVLHWHRFARVFVSTKKHFQGQIIYVTSQDRKDVAFVTVILMLKKLLVHAVLQDLGQNHEVREIGNNDDLWNVFLEETICGT
jgi:hypothetical protein